MSNRMDELEKAKSFNYIVLITLNNSSDIDRMLLLNNLNVDDGLDVGQIEKFARNIFNGARILGVIQGNLVQVNRKKLFHRNMIITKEQFINEVKLFSSNPFGDDDKFYEEIREMESFFKDK